MELAAILKIVSAIVSGVVAPFALWWLKEVYRGEKKEKTEEEPSVTEEEKDWERQIENELENIRKETEASRVWIAEFHNGGKYIASVQNSSMKKMSIRYEVVDAGVSEEKQMVTNVLVSFFSEMVRKIIEDDYVKYEGGETDVDPEVELLFRQRGTEKMHLFSMKDIDNILIGVMGIDYTRDDKELSNEEIQYLNSRASLLAGYTYAIKNQS